MWCYISQEVSYTHNLSQNFYITFNVQNTRDKKIMMGKRHKHVNKWPHEIKSDKKEEM